MFYSPLSTLKTLQNKYLEALFGALYMAPLKVVQFYCTNTFLLDK